jgi:hypothetical protein
MTSEQPGSSAVSPQPPVDSGAARHQADVAAPAVQLPNGAAPVSGYRQPTRPIGRTQGAWGLWWLCGLTFGIYYLIWFQRINRELCAFAPEINRADASCTWWSQLIPIYGLVALAKTAGRVNATNQLVGSPARVSSFTTWFWAPAWFGSQTRYLQRRINALWDTATSLHVNGATS